MFEDVGEYRLRLPRPIAALQAGPGEEDPEDLRLPRGQAAGLATERPLILVLRE